MPFCNFIHIYHASFYYFLLYRPSDQPFKFTKTLKSRTVTENHKVVLECEVDEAEAPVEWFYGDQKLTPDSKG